MSSLNITDAIIESVTGTLHEAGRKTLIDINEARNNITSFSATYDTKYTIDS